MRKTVKTPKDTNADLNKCSGQAYTTSPKCRFFSKILYKYNRIPMKVLLNFSSWGQTDYEIYLQEQTSKDSQENLETEQQ